ncbi:MAG: hypothetical protein NXH73_05175 [Flavobacteriaceae bacterium]|nr:hypothetical protein [Flavobacteriaceae bacterium]
MKIEHLDERVNEYKNSIKTVVEKRLLWKNTTKKLIVNTLKKAEVKYPIGWQVQELNWIHSNEAVNITFDSFPPELIELTNQLPTYQFLQGSSLVFTLLHNGDVSILILFAIPERSMPTEDDSEELGSYSPEQITETLITEKIDNFLKEVIKRDVPLPPGKMGFSKEKN